MLIVSLVAAAIAGAGPAEGPSPDAAFRQLSALSGRWRGAYADGSQHDVAYRLVAKGSVLVETWTMSPTRESVTVYYLADGALEAVHYCPQGNQPRLRYDPKASGSALRFRLVGGDNLGVEGAVHQHAFSIMLDSPQQIRRSETYVPNGASAAEADAVPEGEVVTYRPAP